MIDKVKSILTILLALIILFSIIYSIVSVINSMIQKPVLLNSSKLDEYINDENMITDYNSFYFAEACVGNLIEGCKREMYNELYNLYLNDYIKQYSKDEVISKLRAFNLQDIDYKLNYLYKVDNLYLLDVQIDDSQTYMIFDLANSKEYDYKFAFFK